MIEVRRHEKLSRQPSSWCNPPSPYNKERVSLPAMLFGGGEVSGAPDVGLPGESVGTRKLGLVHPSTSCKDAAMQLRSG